MNRAWNNNMNTSGLVITSNEAICFLLAFIVLVASSSSLVTLPSALLLFTLFLKKRKEVYFFWSILAPRITGNAPIMRYLLELAREEGPGNLELPDLLEIRLPFLPSMFFLIKPSYVKRVLSMEPHNFPTGGDETPIISITAGSGKNIFAAKGPPDPHWAKFREVTAPLNKDRFGESSLLANMFHQAWKTSQELSIQHFSSKLDSSIDLFRALFYIMIPAHNQAIFGEEFARKFSYKDFTDEMFDVINETGKRLALDITPPSIKASHSSKIRNIENAVRNMMKSSTSPFMQPLQDAHKSGKLSDEELMSNVMVFAYAHAPLHEVFWLLYSLSLHPEEEQRVVAEIANVLSKGPMTYERLSEFKYLAKVSAETHRLYPSVGLMQVRSSKLSTQFGSHYVPAGSFIFLSHYLIHRNATYWPNPDEFIPSREGIDHSKYGENPAYIPFGSGPRQCQGQYFASDVIKVTAIAILQHYKLTIAPGQKQANPTENLFLRPEHPVYFHFEKRTLPLPTSTTSASTSTEILSTAPSSTSLQVSSSKLKRAPPKLSKSSKTSSLVSQSQLFRDTFSSLGKLPYPIVQSDLKYLIPRINTHDILVLYGSQTGTARGLAIRVVHMAGLCKLSATLTALNEYPQLTLRSLIKQFKAVVVITSTYGDGGAPENAERFENWLQKETSSDTFSEVPFAVLALGSSMYPFPFKFGNLVSRKVVQLGGKLLIPEERIDEIKYHTQEVFTSWSARLFDEISTKSKVDTSSRELVAKNKLLGFQQFDFNVMQPPFKLTFTDKTLKREARSDYGSNVVTEVVSNKLVNSEPTNQIYSIDLSFPNDALSFQAGDNAIVIPSNPSELVERLIHRLGFKKDCVFTVEGTELSEVTDLACSLGNSFCTLEIALTHFYDITSPPSLSMLKFLAMHSNNTEDQKTILSYVSNYLSFSHLNYSVLDLLEVASSIEFGGDQRHKEEALAIFLGLLGAIKHRHYSIANFPHTTPNTLRIVYKVVKYKVKATNQEKLGLCSNYLKCKASGEQVAISVVKSKFKLPEDSSVPIVMVGAGSGISPYFGFLEQRTDSSTNGGILGKAVLIHGCRTEADFANRGATEAALKTGVISNLWPAYSRKEGGPRTYIQDIVQVKGEEIWNLLNEGAIVYVCGDVNVGIAIRDSLIKIAQVYGKLSTFKANFWLSKLAKDGRLRNDEWGIATSSGVHAIRAARLRLWRKSILAIVAFTRKPSSSKGTL